MKLISIHEKGTYMEFDSFTGSTPDGSPGGGGDASPIDSSIRSVCGRSDGP